MSEEAAAFAPANISLIFETYEATAHHGRGSLGVGCTLDAGVVARVRRAGLGAARSEIRVGGEVWEFPTVAQVVQRLAPEPVRVEIEAAFPFGCGFGMSGAGALATAYALGRLFHLPQELLALAMVAHEAEVDNKTGRGDVGGQFNGGFMVKTVKGAPLAVEWLPIPEQTVWCKIFGPISTASLLGDAERLKEVNAAGHEALTALKRQQHEIDLPGLLRLSRDFADRSGLMSSPRVRAAVKEAEAMGGHASMIMLGEAVVSTVPIPGSLPHRVVKRGAALLPGAV